MFHDDAMLITELHAILSALMPVGNFLFSCVAAYVNAVTFSASASSSAAVSSNERAHFPGDQVTRRANTAKAYAQLKQVSQPGKLLN